MDKGASSKVAAGQHSEAFSLIVTLALATGAKSIVDLPGCWEHQIDAQWWVAVNGHKKPRMCSTGTDVLPFTAYLTFDEWPAGFIDVRGGILAAGAAANEDTLCEALEAALAAARVAASASDSPTPSKES